MEWDAVNDAFGRKLASALNSGIAEVSYVSDGSVTLNYGPVFGVRYISMSFAGGGSTPPNPSYPPGFYVNVYLNARASDWPGLPVVELEKDLADEALGQSKKFLSGFGKAKVRKGGKNWQVGITVSEDVNRDDLAALGTILGRSLNKVLVDYHKKYESSKKGRIKDLEKQIEDLQEDREGLWEDAAEALKEIDEDPWAASIADKFKQDAYGKGIDIIRLQEQLSGITGQKYPKPDFPNRLARLLYEEGVKKAGDAWADKVEVSQLTTVGKDALDSAKVADHLGMKDLGKDLKGLGEKLLRMAKENRGEDGDQSGFAHARSEAEDAAERLIQESGKVKMHFKSIVDTLDQIDEVYYSQLGQHNW